MRLSERNIAKISQASEIIKETSAKEEGCLTFMARTFVQATLPHSDPGDVRAWGRENGHMSISIEPGYVISENQPVSLGIPYGSIPRLLLFWMTTEAVKTKKRELVLGKSLSNFMRELGLNSDSGGVRGDSTRLKEQMKRLFSSRIAITYQDQKLLEREHYNFTSSTRLWWDPQESEKISSQNNFIVLSTEFFEEIIDRPIPADMRALEVLKQSPLALDLYAWLTYRVSYLNKKQLITWTQLHSQFGSDFTNIRSFRFKVRNYLKRIYLIYPALKLEDTASGLLLHPSPVHIPTIK